MSITMPNPISLLNIEDILEFQAPGKDKALNNTKNNIRENVIEHLDTIGPEYLEHEVYGSKWKILQEKFREIIRSLCLEPYNGFKITRKGGMKNNWDFIVSFLGSGQQSLISEVKLEFKHNTSSVLDTAQFLELYDRDVKEKFELCEVSYGEFYYEHYLPRYVVLEENCTQPIPEKSEYLKHSSNIKYEHPFFHELYALKDNKVEEKRELAKESIREFINKYSSTFVFDKIAHKIKESQQDKQFLLWDCNQFHIETVDTSNIKISGILENSARKSAGFTVNVENFKYNIHILINWGNNAGLCNPRWKFKFVTKNKNNS
jgi:hypothetical protein